ncbi:MAG: response regulator receiver modulated CheB methylesterase [Schlesneria sp.]|nr:response regulator receiver modulated CheB methylesterase [Schlesneria sp.]
MSTIRVLVVDDAVVVRRIVSDVLSADPELEVFTAANGKIGLAKILQVNPDVVMLDIEMPEMDGLETLVEIRKLYPKLIVIMFSTLTQRGAMATLDALARGANDYVTKPANVGGVAAAQQAIREQLIPKIKTLCGKLERAVALPAKPNSVRPTATPRPASFIAAPIDIVAIGVSTGGPNALAEVLPAIPTNFPVPIVIVQHMPPMFTKMLADRLDAQCQIEVLEGATGDVLRPGRAYVAPGGHHMVVKRERTNVALITNQDPPENSCRPAVDVLFRSVVQIYGASVLGVILTGMGQDGLRGCEFIRDAQGQVIAQDEQSSVVWGMPGFVVRAGLADQVMPLNLIAAEIVKRVAKPRRAAE